MQTAQEGPFIERIGRIGASFVVALLAARLDLQNLRLYRPGEGRALMICRWRIVWKSTKGWLCRHSLLFFTKDRD